MENLRGQEKTLVSPRKWSFICKQITFLLDLMTNKTGLRIVLRIILTVLKLCHVRRCL